MMKKKLISLFLLFCMLVTLMPTSAMASYLHVNMADSGGNYGLLSNINSLELDGYTAPSGLTVETTTPDLPWKFNTESGYLTSGNMTAVGSATLSNLKVTASEAGYLKFEFASPKADASYDIFAWKKNVDFTKRSDATNVADRYYGESSFQEGIIEVTAGESVYFTFSRTKNSSEEGYAQIRNLRLATGGTVTISSSDMSLGSVVSEPEDTTNLKGGTKVNLTATEIDGGQFAGWYETINGTAKLLAVENPYIYTVTENASLQARFIAVAKDAVATVNGKGYDDLQAAMNYAAEDASAASPVTVILQKDVTVEKELTIPANVILLVPYDADDTGTEPNVQTEDTVRQKEAPYRTLTIADSGSLNIEGTLLVNAKLSSSDTNHQGSLGGYYGTMVLNGKAIVSNTGALKVRGLVVGDGNVTAQSGGQIWQAFEMTDWPGGSKAAALNNDKEFPINQYYLQRIQVRTVLEEGASMSAYAYLFVPSDGASLQLPMQGLIGPSESAFFQIKSGNVIMEYDPDSYTSIVSIDGKVDLNSFSLSMGSYRVGTAEVVCPIPGSFAIELETGAEVTITSDMKLLPGASLTVANGATLNVQEGADIYLYGTADYSAARNIPSSSDAEEAITPESGARVVNNGTINNSGSIHTSAADKTKQITGNGQITGNEVLDDYGAENLKYTVTWMNGETVLKTDENVAYGAKPSYDGVTPTKDEDEDYTYAFSGWQDRVGADLTDETTVTGDVTYYAQYTATEKPKGPAFTIDLGSGGYPWIDGTAAPLNYKVGTNARTDYYYSSNFNQNSSKSVMTITVTPKADGYLSFDYIASGEKNWDYLKIEVDGVWGAEKLGAADEANSQDWTNYKVFCGANSTTVISLTYMKDIGTHKGSDRAFVSDIQYKEQEGVRSPLVVTVGEHGSVSGSTLGAIISGESYSVVYGKTEILTAVPDDGYKFIGWYEGETRKSSDTTYQVKGAEGIQFELEAKFEEADANSLTINFADGVNVTVKIGEGDTQEATSGQKFIVYESRSVTVSFDANGYIKAALYEGNTLRSSSGSYTYSSATEGNRVLEVKDSYQEIAGLSVPDGLTLKTNASSYPWTLQEDGSLQSGNQRKGNTTYSNLAIMAGQTGMITFDYKVSGYDSQYYGLFRKIGAEISSTNYTSVSTSDRLYGEKEGTVQVVVNADDVLFLGYRSASTSSYSTYKEDLAWISNIRFTSGTGKSISVTKDSNEENSTFEVTGVTNGVANFNASVTLTAKPDGNAIFDGWYEIKGEERNRVATNLTYTFNATEDRSIVAVFHRKADFSITPTFNENGSVGYALNDADATAATSEMGIAVKEADKIVLTATKNDDAIFDGWYEGDTRLTTSNVYTINPVKENRSIEARFHAKAEYSLTATFENGTASYTVNGGDAIDLTTGSPATVKEADKVVVAATANDGYQFLGWFSGEERVATSTGYTINSANGNIALTAKFVAAAADPVAKIKATGVMFDDLSTAFSNAYSGDVVVLLKDYTLTEDMTVPAGVTLLVPYSDSSTADHSTTPDFDNNIYKKPSVFRTLSLSSNVKLTVNGTLVVDGKLSAAGQNNGHNGTPSTAYGRILADVGSSIEVENGGLLTVWGYITAESIEKLTTWNGSGSSAVNIKSGGILREAFQIRDWRGGTHTSNLEGSGVFPFSQYYVQNIEVPLTLYADAEEKVTSGVYASSATRKLSDLNFVGSKGLFNVKAGYIRRSYDGITDRVIYDIYGDLSVQSISFSVSAFFLSINVTSTDYLLPLNGNLAINVHQGTTDILSNQRTIFLPGIVLTVDEGAILSLPNMNYICDATDWPNNAVFDGVRLRQLDYVAVRNGAPNTRMADVDAKFDVNGMIQIDGSLYTTTNGANITSSGGTGIIRLLSASPENGTIKQSSAGSANLTINVTPAQLLNADGTYTQTAGSTADTTFYYANGTWTKDFTLTYDANAGEEEIAVPEEATYALDGTATITVASALTREGYIFTGWNTAAEPTEEEPGTSYEADAEVPVTQSLGASMTLYAQWEGITGYAVTVENKTGSTTPAVVSIESGSLQSGETTFYVTCEKACVVVVDNGDGTYTRRTATATGTENTYSFTINVAEEMTIVVAIKGDLTLDGEINSTDAMQAQRYDAKLRSLSALQILAADINKDGEVNSTDAMQIQRCEANLRSFNWDT